MSKLAISITVAVLSALFVLACENEETPEPMTGAGDSGITVADAIKSHLNDPDVIALDSDLEGVQFDTTTECDPSATQTGDFLSDELAARIVAHVMRKAVDVDIATHNLGGFQTNVFPNERPWGGQQVTTHNLHCVVFENQIIVLEMTGLSTGSHMMAMHTSKSREKEAVQCVKWSPQSFFFRTEVGQYSS